MSPAADYPRGMKSVLWVTAIEPCFDAGGGGQIRQAHLINALADRFEVGLMLAGTLADPRVRSRLSFVQEVPVALPAEPTTQTRRRLRDIRWQLFERQSQEIARHRSVRAALRSALLRRPAPDIVCVEYLGLAGLLPKQRHGFWSLTLHNLPSEMARHNARLAPGLRQRAMQGQEERNSRRTEHWAAESYDLVVAVSPDDAAKLPGHPVVVPNGVDIDWFRFTPVPSAPRVVFTGALHTLPNRDGIEWFCRAVWPLIRTQVPAATLDVVGARPPAEVLALQRMVGVTVHPNVADVRPYLERARVAVVPLRIGSGSRLKALEAMAAGRPVVGSRIGIGGLDVASGEHVLIADAPTRFAEAVVSCLTRDDLAQQLVSAGRGHVERSCSWRQIGADYAALLDERSPA